MVTTTGFSTLARMTGKAGGIDDLRTAEYPGPIGIHDTPQIERNVRDVLIDRVIRGLTMVDAPAASDRAVSGSRYTDIVFTGTADEVSRFFHEREWSDGLPVVAPTVERVERFLRFTSRSPHAEIAVLPSANLRATAWNVAVNGVMAGCRPEHMPLLVAAAEALGDEHCSLNMIGSSSAILPYVLINGPIAKQLGFESGAQLISRGSNPVIGRALGLIVRNIAGFRPGANYMGTFGYQLAIALAENEDESPWEPFHVEHGFERAASTVTIGVTNNWGPSPGAASTADVSGADAVLELLSREITKKTRLYNFPARGPDAEHVMITLLMSPSVAKTLAAAGYSKESVKQHLYEHTRISLRDFAWNLEHVSIMRTSVRAMVEVGVYPHEYLGAPDDSVRLLSSPDILHIIVCGDPNRNRLMVMEGGHTTPTIRQVEVAQQGD